MTSNSSADNSNDAIKVPHIFMGHNEETIALLPNGYGLYFLAILSHRSGLDKSALDLMRPLFDNGLRVEAFHKLLKELHAKEYCRKMLC